MDIFYIYIGKLVQNRPHLSRMYWFDLSTSTDRDGEAFFVQRGHSFIQLVATVDQVCTRRPVGKCMMFIGVYLVDARANLASPYHLP